MPRIIHPDSDVFETRNNPKPNFAKSNSRPKLNLATDKPKVNHLHFQQGKGFVERDFDPNKVQQSSSFSNPGDFELTADYIEPEDPLNDSRVQHDQEEDSDLSRD